MIRVAIIGAGRMGAVHCRHYQRIPGVELAVFDVDPVPASSFSAAHKIDRIESLADAFSWADAVDLCVPNDLHAELCLRAIADGKAVFVEKPIAESVETATAVVEAAEKACTPLMVGHVVRFFPEYRRAHDLVKEGKLGSIAAVRMRRGGGLPASDWFLDHRRSGGVLVDLAVHEFDWLRWTLGPVKHVYAKSVGASTDRGPDYGLATLTFASGAVAHVEATWMDPGGFKTEFEVCGSEGMLQFDNRKAATLCLSTDGVPRFEAPLADHDDPYFRQLSGFVNALQHDLPVPVTGRDGLEALRIALAARESAKTGQVVRLD